MCKTLLFLLRHLGEKEVSEWERKKKNESKREEKEKGSETLSLEVIKDYKQTWEYVTGKWTKTCFLRVKIWMNLNKRKFRSYSLGFLLLLSITHEIINYKKSGYIEKQ